MRLALLVALLFLSRVTFAQTTNSPPADADATSPKPPASPAKPVHLSSAAQMQATIDKLTQSNHDLLELLKEQQSVLQDIQYDRRQQSRHIQSLEERLEDALQENAKLQGKVSTLAADAAVHPPVPLQPLPNPTTGAASSTNAPPAKPEQVAADVTPTTPPESYLPPAPPEIPGGKSWYRLFTLKGNETKQTDLFHIQGKTWRVVWHNQDPDDAKLKGTSGLFIDAYPKDDTIPQHACAKVGTGGDSSMLQGPGDYYLKITASGGSWEMAVEDFR